MMIKPATPIDANNLEKIYAAAFESNARFFPDDMEEDGEEEGEDFSLEDAISSSDKTVLGIWEDGCLVGGAVISVAANGVYTLERLFILPEKQGKGYGYRAWKEIEKTHPEAKGWELRTPTCLINNVCFYVNKCGFSIVRVEDMGSDGVGMYVFRKGPA